MSSDDVPAKDRLRNAISRQNNARINEMPHPPLPGQGGALALVCQILRPRGWEICRNLYLFIREHMLHVVSTFDPGGGSFDTRHLANPHPTPGGGGWGISLIRA